MKKLIILAIATLFISAAFAQQEERIIRFHSDIKIETDGRIEVAEHIRVYAGGKEIRRGIIREIPLYRENNKGKKVRMDYNVLAVRRNGADTRYEIKEENGNMLIYIRDMNVLLDPGEYDFTVVYESYGQVGFFDDFDELYWNVTGNTSVFAVEQASAAITLPRNANAIRTDFYTGVSGAKGKDCRVEDRGNMQVFTSTRRLAPREGLTVAVAFPRDVITRPPPPAKAQALWNDNNYAVCGLAGAAIFLLFSLISILIAGRRPVKPVAIPAFTPPRNLSPASIRYIATRVFDNKAFTATLVEMAVKCAMSIRCEKKKKYSLVNKMNTERLRPEELQMHATFFGGSKKISEVKVDNINFKKFSKAETDLEKAMKKQWNLKDYFHVNKLHIGTGGLILNAIFALYIILTGATAAVGIAFSIACPFIVLEISSWLTAAISSPKTGCGLGVVMTIFIVIIVMMAVGENVDQIIHWPSVVFFAAMSLAYFFYTRRIRMFTAEGATLNAEIDGFKMYLKTAEEHRLNMLTPPERTPELFERLLPYSIALDVANDWCEKFDDVLKRINYQPEWYNGAEDISVTGFATTFSALSTSFDRSVGNAQKDPSSSDSSGSSDWSSGSSGGGYSGGGGGGGGVGGC